MQQRQTDWAEAELEVLYRVFPEGGAAACMVELPHRSLSALRGKARRLGIGFADNENLRWGRPTSHEIMAKAKACDGSDELRHRTILLFKMEALRTGEPDWTMAGARILSGVRA